MTRRTAAIAAILITLGIAQVGRADDEEFRRHLAEQRRQIDDRELPMARRERLALDLAATLDRAAMAAGTAEERRRLWAEASKGLEDFNKAHSGHPQAALFTLQATVYDWARARTWVRQAELDPADEPARKRAIEILDPVIDRLRRLESTVPSEERAIAQNTRYRLAQALADRSEFKAEGSVDRRIDQEKALAELDPPITERSLRGFAELLRADLLARLGRFDDADEALRNSGKVEPSPPAEEVRGVEVEILLGRKQFDRALAVADAAPKDDRAAARLGVRVRLAQRAALPEGAARSSAEADAFRRAEALRATDSPEARLALLALARAIPEPDRAQSPEAWDALAEGHRLRGDPERAGRLVVRGAERAEALGDPDKARALRYRAAAIMFQAGKYAEADALLTPIADDPGAGSIGPKASLLRVLARGRAPARGGSGGRDAYVRALEGHLRRFPDDPTAAEARWLLGQVRLDAGRRDEAVALWSAIPADSPRRLDAVLTTAGLLRDDVATQQLNGDHAAIENKMEKARGYLGHALTEMNGRAQDEIRLTLAELELLPDVGRPEEARQAVERLIRDSSDPDLKRRARLARLVALAEQGRYVDAEREIPEATAEATAAEVLETARRFDRFADAADTDLTRRRTGRVLLVLLARLLERSGDPEPPVFAEARLRQVRALLFSGDRTAAREAVEQGSIWITSLPMSLMADLADTYERIDAHALAIDVYRLRLKQTRPGTLPWFEARYGLACSYEGAGQVREARQLIDATALLHPDLGGGELRAKFDRLRRRLGPG